MNQLAQIVQTSGLEKAESQSIIERFGTYETVAKEWEEKAKMIVVTDASQTAEMAMAKVARQKFSNLRIEVEKARKAMKEQSLRKGQAIDAIARFLVSLIIPIEEHLKEQEDFVKIQVAKKMEEQRIEAEKKAEQERIAKEEADRKEQERIRVENAKLKDEAEKREKAMREAREKALEKQRALEAKARMQRELAQKKLDKEREAREKIQKQLQEQKEKAAQQERDRLAAIKKQIAEEARKKAEALKAPDRDKTLAYITTLLAVPRPEVHDAGMQQAIKNAIIVLNDIRDDIINSNKTS